MPAARRRPPFPAVIAACLRQWITLSADVEQLPDDVFLLSTRLPRWRVSELVAHLTAVVSAVAVRLAEPESAPAITLSLSDYLLATPSSAEVIGQREIDAADGREPSRLKEDLDTAVKGLALALNGIPADRIVITRFGALRLDDFVLSRCIEGVVHGLDLAQVPGVVTISDLDALTFTTRALLDTLVAKAPGRSVELRVPPIAAVQVVEGPRHTRGTPANVVEVGPDAWIELAAGRVAWRDAVADGRVRASGERSDLSALLPLL